MPLTKNELIPPARRELGMLQELVDNRRQIRAREYERYRREISIYEDLRNVQKPLINVLKGLLEDRNTWDIKKMADGRVEWAKLSWSNLSPILQQLNRMDRNEATEVLTDISNKLPNALTAQRDLVTRLGALFAAKPAEQTVTTQDLDTAGLLTPLRREFRVGDQTEGFSPARPLYTGRRDREPDGAADAAPSPDSVQPPRYARAGQEPIITPPHPDADAERAGLPSSGTYDTMAELDQKYDPTTISLAGDLLSISQEQVDETLTKAADLAESNIPLAQLDLRDLQQSTVGRRIVDLVEIISEAKGSRGTEVQGRAEKELQKFKDAEKLAQTLRGTPLAENIIRRGSNIRETPKQEETPASWSDAIMKFGEREKVLPYRTNPLATLGQMAQQLSSGQQPFATGFAGERQMGDSGLDMVHTQEILKKKEQDSPITFDDIADERFAEQKHDDREIITGAPALENMKSSIGSAPNRTVLTRMKDGSISIFGQILPDRSVTPKGITWMGITQPLSPNMFKALSVGNAVSIKAIPLTPEEKRRLFSIAKDMDYDGFRRTKKGKEISASNPINAEHEARILEREPPHGAVDLEARAEPHQLEGMEQMNFPTGFDEMVGRGNKKWSPLKVAPNGDLGEVNISLPDLINNLELVVKRKEGGKVMLRRKECPIDLIRLLTRRFNPKIKYNEKARELYKKVITLGKIPLGQTFSHKEHIFGTGIKVPTKSQQAPQSIINNSEPEDVMESLMVELGTFRNGNRSSILKNNISASADFLLKRDMIDKAEHKLIHTMIRRKGTQLTQEENELLTELFN